MIEEQGKRLAAALIRLKSIDFWRLIDDMTAGEVQLLAAICSNADKAAKISDLYGVCGMLPAAVSRLMNSLEEKGYITRSARRNDRRVTDVRATANGQSVNERNLGILHGYWREALESLSPDELNEMLRVQEKLLDSMERALKEKTEN